MARYQRHNLKNIYPNNHLFKMSQKVNAVPDPSFSVPPLTTVAGSRVSRRRVKIPSNNVTATYTPSSSPGTSTIQFDIADNESFLDMEKSMMTFDFTPVFMNDNGQTRLYPLHNLGFDGSSQSLIANLRIGNSQGLIIEELQAYATFANIMESYTQSENQSENSLYDYTSSGSMIANKGDIRGVPESSKILHSSVRKRMFLKFKHSSFLKACRMIPLFLMRNGIRFEIQLQDAYKLFTRHLKPDWQGPAFAHKTPNSVTGSTAINEFDVGIASTQDSRNHIKGFDWFCIRDQNRFGIVVKKESRLAQILNLRHLTGPARYYHARAANSSSTDPPVAKSGNDFVVPLKIVYTDEFGVDKVYLQSNFYIEQSMSIMGNTAELAPRGVPDLTEGLILASETVSFITATGLRTGGVARGAGEEEVYLLSVVSETDGFSSPFMSAVAPFNTNAYVPFLPYARFQPRIYADVNDIAVYVNPTTIFTAATSFAMTVYTDALSAAQALSSANADSVSVFHGQTRYANRAIYDNAVEWTFRLQNVEMLCDMVKPSSEVFLQFQQAFQAPAGIPYAFKRVLYRSNVIPSADGIAQISLPVSVRSLRGVVVVLSDVYSSNLAPGDATRKHYPAITAFQKRGLTRAQLTIGGQNYPAYDLNLTELGLEQIPELECLFNVSGLGGFNPSFDVTELLSTSNYAIGLGRVAANGSPSTTVGTNAFNGSWTDVTNNVAGGNMGVQEYHDTSKFVLGLSTMKKDGDFVTGVDTSQAGSVFLNLQFKKDRDVPNGYPGDYGGRSGRPILVQTYAICDAVFTLQNDANLVRY
jgi:hypothetical protein